jgi:hypothetical protein
MIPSLAFFPKLLIAGGASFLGTLSIPSQPALENHTLAGEKVKATNVVCRTCWGTPMPPDERAGYRVTAPLRGSLIRESLWVPPVNNAKPSFKPVPVSKQPTATPASPAVQTQASQDSSGKH